MAITAQRVSLVRFESLQSKYLHLVTAALFTGLAPLTGTPACADPVPVHVHIVRIDGTVMEGAWDGSVNGAQIEVLSPTDATNIPLDGLASIDFDNPSEPPVGDAVFFFADGSRLTGQLIVDSKADSATPSEDHMAGQTILGDSTNFTFQQLAAIRLARAEDFRRAEELFNDARASRLPGHDLLITRSADEPRALRGQIESVVGHGGSFHFGDRTRSFRFDKIFGIVFASGVSKPQEHPDATTIKLTDGSALVGQLLSPDVCGDRPTEQAVCLAIHFGRSATIPLTKIRRIDIRSHRVVYVSDLTPTQQRIEGLLHKKVAGESPWPLRINRSVNGGPLSLGGRIFLRGLGVHSRTEITFKLDGEYESFVATIGLDDSVRPRGSVAFRVLGQSDEQTPAVVLFDSDLITGQDAPRDIIVPLDNVTNMTLLVDYGDDLDLADAAVWGDARLLKPEAQSERKAP
jgi:hypothetical protein